ncbi:VanZ family protein [Lentilactobacillus sp. Marseille-Q4993]|uniref:VanZ family protein n=1 Tax=Lentilactobacillus sp. Marseille-Q4993 TaxID=3039492 RepID=UPI0024BC23FF|nr:VanZ family protein [Lentilactobacillus sp. Marseille-Q4993]
MSQYMSIIRNAVIFFPFVAALITIPILIFNYRKYGAIPKWNILMMYSFVFYMMCAYFFIILPLPPVSYVAHLHTPTYNLRPFTFVLEFIKHNPFSALHPGTWVAAIKAPTVLQPAFNIVLTIPFGFYLHYYFKRNLKQTILFSLLLSLFYELTQLSGLYGIYPRPYRLFDVDDLMLNTIGGVIGFYGASLIGRFLPNQEKIREKAHSKSQNISVIRRATALFIDLVIVNIVTILINFLPINNDFGLPVAFVLVIILPELFLRQTIGLKVLNMKITDKFGNQTHWWQIILRNLFGYGIIGGSFITAMKLLELTGTVPYSELSKINIFLGQISVVILLIFIDLLIEFFSIKHRLFFERLSGTDTRSTYKTKDLTR